MTTACMSRSWKIEVCQKKKTLEDMVNQQAAAIRSTSSTKQHKLIRQLRTNTRDRLHLTGKRSQQRSQGPQQQQSTPSYCLLTTTFMWRRRRNLYIIQPSRPRGRIHSQCCCVAFPCALIVITTTSSSFSHACACHVYIHVCTCTYRNSIRKCTTMIPTAIPWGFF